MQSASAGGGDVPPQFIPGERRRTRETPAPKEPRSVDDLVSDIKRVYRESRLKKPSDEKSVRQQDEGRVSERAPAESLSEAIGNKFREKKNSDAEKSNLSTPTESPRTPSKREHRERIGPKINMQYPEVRGEKVDSKQRLHELVDGEYSALRKKKDLPKRMREAEAHLDLIEKYAGKERIEHGEMTRIAKNLNIDAETVSNWVTQRDHPRLYSYMNWSTPKSEAAEKVRQLQEANNGICSAQDVQERLDTYYLGKEERGSHFYERELKKMDKYFEFLELYKQGGMHLDIVKEAGLSESGAGEYLKGSRPWLVRLAAQIPTEQPQEGYKWLPKSAGRNAMRDDWIQVPEKVTDFKQVMDVVTQLKALDNEDMKRWDMKYGGGYSLEERFMHLLGTYVSDSRVSSESTSSIAFGISLSKNYDWSYDFGEAACYNLGKIGIYAHRTSDKEPAISRIKTPYGTKEIKGGPQYDWQSENSPLLRWIRRTCLGYNETPKTYQPVDAEWILRAPENLRRAFLQGLSDGDGGVCIKGYYFSISTHSNHDFVEELLRSLGVELHDSGTYLRTTDYKAVSLAARIPPFKYAAEKRAAVEKIAAMIESRRRSLISNPPSQNEIDFMKENHQRGLSYAETGENLFDQYGYTLDARDIRRIVLGLKRTMKKTG